MIYTLKEFHQKYKTKISLNEIEKACQLMKVSYDYMDIPFKNISNKKFKKLIKENDKNYYSICIFNLMINKILFVNKPINIKYITKFLKLASFI